MIEFHEPDNHALFPHRFIITKRRYVRTKTGRKLIPASEFVICALCGHWIDVPLSGKCDCIVGCHSEARSESLEIGGAKPSPI